MARPAAVSSPSHLPGAGSLCWAPHKKWGVSWCLGAWLADTEPSYLCKDLPLAHPQDGGADSSQDPGEAGSTLALIREMSFLADTDVGPDSCAAPCAASQPHLASPAWF